MADAPGEDCMPADQLPEGVVQVPKRKTASTAKNLPTSAAAKKKLMEQKQLADKRAALAAAVQKGDAEATALLLEAARNPEEEAEAVFPEKRKRKPKGKAEGEKGKRGRPKTNPDAPATAKVNANYSDIEDVCLCKAYVNCTVNPVKGNNQKGDTFWKGVHATYEEFMEKEDKDLMLLQQRDSKSLMNRFKKTIMPSVNLFNACYVEVKRVEKSGWSPSDYVHAAMDEFEKKEHAQFKKFKFSHVWEILKKINKFNVDTLINRSRSSPASETSAPTKEDQSTSSAEKVSRIGEVQGSNLERPQGSKAAKRLKAESEKRDEVVKSRNDSMARIAASSDFTAKNINYLASTIGNSFAADQKSALARQYFEMGMFDDAKRLMKEIEEQLSKNIQPIMNPMVETVANQSLETNPPVADIQIEEIRGTPSENDAAPTISSIENDNFNTPVANVQNKGNVPEKTNSTTTVTVTHPFDRGFSSSSSSSSSDSESGSESEEDESGRSMPTGKKEGKEPIVEV